LRAASGPSCSTVRRAPPTVAAAKTMRALKARVPLSCGRIGGRYFLYYYYY
jgi:hypothetical protein